MDWLMTGHWPWWFGGPVFALLVVGIWMVERRFLGGSSSYAGLLTPAPEGDEAMRRLEAEGDEAMQEAMLAATLAEFGQEAVDEMEAELAAVPRDEANEREQAPALPTPRSEMPRSAHLAFLLMLVAGGAVSALMTGGWEPRFTLGALHTSYTGGGALTVAVLVVGGLLVGFGTRMAGGCTTGHGLSGCSRMQPGSLAATASFFGAAVAVSFLFEMLVGS